jgi:hypothetical protein
MHSWAVAQHCAALLLVAAAAAPTPSDCQSDIRPWAGEHTGSTPGPQGPTNTLELVTQATHFVVLHSPYYKFFISRHSNTARQVPLQPGCVSSQHSRTLRV